MDWSIDLKQHLGPRRTDRCRKLAEAAIFCFAEKGLAQTRVEDITSEAGLSRSQFYYFFEDKTDCFTACHRLSLAELEARLTKATVGAESWQEQLQSGVAVAAKTLSENPDLARVVMLEAQLAGTDADKQARQAATTRLAGALEHIFQEADPGIDATSLASDMAIGSARQVLARRLEEQAYDPGETASELIIALMASVLGPERAHRLARTLSPAVHVE